MWAVDEPELLPMVTLVRIISRSWASRLLCVCCSVMSRAGNVRYDNEIARCSM